MLRFRDSEYLNYNFVFIFINYLRVLKYLLEILKTRWMDKWAFFGGGVRTKMPPFSIKNKMVRHNHLLKSLALIYKYPAFFVLFCFSNCVIYSWILIIMSKKFKILILMKKPISKTLSDEITIFLLN